MTQVVKIMNAILEQLKKHFDNTPRDIIEVEWGKFDIYDDVGLTVNDFLCSKDESLFDWKITLEKTDKISETPNLYSEFFLSLYNINNYIHLSQWITKPHSL